MTAYVGRATAYSFLPALGSANNKTLAELDLLSWLYIGATRGKENDSSWTTTDATTSDSHDYKKQSLVTFVESTLKIDGVAYDEDSYNIPKLEAAINYPDATYQRGEPYMWIKEVNPVFGTRYHFCLGTKCTITSSFDDVIKYSAEFSVLNTVKSNGEGNHL